MTNGSDVLEFMEDNWFELKKRFMKEHEDEWEAFVEMEYATRFE